jgi:hypothetical protein
MTRFVRLLRRRLWQVRHYHVVHVHPTVSDGVRNEFMAAYAAAVRN